MEYGMSAGVGATDPSSAMSTATLSAFPQYPGENCLAHAAAQYKEQVDARLTGAGLLAVAQGEDPPAVRSIILYDLTRFPELPPTHPQYERRLETRMKYEAINAANLEKREQITLTAWTTLYTLFKTSTEATDPVLSRELLDMCDLAKTHGLPGGYFDGPRAYTVVMGKLGSKRGSADKKFYRLAESRVLLAPPPQVAQL